MADTHASEAGHEHTRGIPGIRVPSLLAALVALVLLVSACGGGDDGGSASDDGTADGADDQDDAETLEPVDGGQLVFGVEADSDGYHPINNRWAISGNFVGSAMYEPLLVENGDGTLRPWLAESVEPNDDATEWTITVKEGISFHDGTPFDAEAVASNVQARKDGALTSAANEPIEEVEVLDDGTAVVRMNEPWAAYDHTLAAVGGYMVAPAQIEDPELDPIGTGPFTFVEWIPNDHLTVERNDDYWRDPAHLDRIEFRFLPDQLARTAAVQAGDVDAVITPDAESIKELQDDDAYTVLTHSSEPFHVMLNAAVPPFENPTAREALAYGTDREALIRTLGGEGVLEPASTPFLPSNPWHLEDNGYPDYDPDRARELVEQYEQEAGEDLTVTIKGSAGQQEDLAQALIEQWSAIGVDATFEPLEQASFLGAVFVGEYEAALFRSHNWIDPDFNYIFWHSSNSNPLGEISINFTHVENDDLDAALDRGRETLDTEVRGEAYDEVQRILNEELTQLWLYEQVWALVSQDDVHGWDVLDERGLSRLEPKIVWSDVWMQQ